LAMLTDHALAKILDADLQGPSTSGTFLNVVDRVRHGSPPAIKNRKTHLIPSTTTAFNIPRAGSDFKPLQGE